MRQCVGSVRVDHEIPHGGTFLFRSLMLNCADWVLWEQNLFPERGELL